MAVLDLVLYPDAPLKQRAEPFTAFGVRASRLAEDMFETMHTYDGVGLAGPQVGVARRILVCQAPEYEPLCLINPEILSAEGGAEGEEGCLSLPDVYATVTRATRISVRAQDPHGKAIELEARDFLARVIQHEMDHLDGIVFPDRLDILTRQAKLREWEEVRARLLASSIRG